MFWKNRLKKYLVKNRNRTHIEAEEVFLDSEAVRSIEEKGKMEKPIESKNFIIFFAVVLLALSGLFLRSGYLQVARGDYYSELAKGNRLRVYSISPPRGIIYDKNREPLVYNVPNFDLVINFSDFLEQSESEMKNELREIVSIIRENSEKRVFDSSKTVSEIAEDLSNQIITSEKQNQKLNLVPDLDRSSALILESRVDKWTGILVEEAPRRKYLDGEYFAHIIGYTGRISDKELEKHQNYDSNSYIGKTGLEKYYEEELRGVPGQKQIEVNSLGKTQGMVAVKKPEPGNSLVLSVDKELQKKLHESLSETMEKVFVSGDDKRNAAAVAMNPKNGKVLAAVSLPSFDNNLFARGISKDELSRLESDSANPFLTRFSVGQYPPGSLIKPLIAAAGLSENMVDPYESINCQGELAVANQYTDKVHHFRDWKTHGKTDMIKAIAESCNVYFYTLGGGHEDREGLGPDIMENYLHKFGLEKQTQIDLPHEEDGLIPDKQWKLKTKDEKWYLGDTYHLSIGQGDVLTTPLQITNALSTIANGGTLYRPQFLDKIIDSDKKVVKTNESEILNRNFLNREDVSVVRRGMREAVKSGSASRLNSLEVALAGKTGTAQFGSEGKTHSWFGVFGPYEDPEIMLTVLIEGGGGGHDAAVPVAEKVLKWYFSEK